MELVHTVEEVRARHEAARAAGGRVGLVPTMGFLHDGHRSLMVAAAAECAFVTVTIFVNPLQFGPNEDLDAYPRDLEGDLALAEGAGVSLVFAPSVHEMYPDGEVLTSVRVRGLADQLEGASRPGHFDGVATVVSKLFSIAGPCRAYFGEKDYQQLQIVTRMARDLSMPVDVVPCATVREPNGLARSSRALDAGVAAIEAGERRTDAVERRMAEIVATEGQAALDYARVVDAATLETRDVLNGTVRLLIAARVGPARLIDNVGAVAH